MSDMYIKPKKAFTKIKQANGLTRPVYIFGASGFGKTSLALSFLSKKSYTYISCQNDKWNISGLLDHISSKRITNVVIDDLQYLTNVRCQEELISLIENENVWTVMICRSRMPSWLTGCYFRRSFTLIGESDLCLGTDEAKQLFKETGADILPEKLEEICTVSRGNPFVLRCIRDALASGCTPDEDNDFFILDRFKYMVKIRCYITRKKYLRAFSLIEKMKNYAHNYDRTYISMELGILSSILNYRCGKPWKEEFTATLEEISSYDFIRIISVDGAAVLPLLREVYGEYDGRDQRYADWLFRVLEETERMASAYPLYMKAHSEDIPAISGNAKKILYLQAQGRSLSEIAYELDMKESTIKYHIKENYRKLEVNNKIDAVMTAKRLGVI